MNRSSVFLAVLAVLFLAAPATYAQSNLASVTGVVTDSGSAVIPGARVALRNTDTGLSWEMETNETGAYTFVSIPPGPYELTAESEGFQKFVKTAIVLETGQQYRSDMQLELGELTETVTVTAEVAPLNTENGAIKGDVIVRQEIQALPLDGRDFTNLAFLVPGVIPAGSGFGAAAGGGRGGARMSVNGARGDQTNFYVDGASNRNPGNGDAQVRPNLDAIEEFKMEVSGFSAEYGGYSGGIMNMSLRSGTNEFHGTFFESLRNEALDARGFFDQERLKLRRNQFGATIGGPIRQNKTFFMASYEAQIQSIGRTGFGRIPTALEKQGDFSQSVDPRAVQGQLRPVRLADPDAGGRCAARVITGCFPNNQIPLSRMDPIGQRLMEFYPNPTVDDIRFNFISAANDDDNWHSFVGKLDHRFSDNDNVSVSYQKRFNNQENPFAGSALALWGDETTDRRSLLSANWTHTFSPTFIMETQGGFSRQTNFADSIATGVDVRELGLPVAEVEDENFVGFPRFSVRNYVPIGQSSNTPRSSRITDVQSNISFNWIKDSHLIKWGATFSRVYLNQPQNGNVRGTFNIQGRFTGSSLGDLLLGQLQNVSRRVGVTTNNFRSNSYGLFVSDDWKITRDLTLNLGLRYEIDLAPLDTNDRLATFVPGLDQIVLASDKDLPDLDSLLADVPTLLERVTTADAVGLGRRLIDTDWNNFAPRVGFAWRPFGSTKNVIRGGWGIFYQGYLLNPVARQLGGIFPFTFNETFQSTRTPAPTLQDPFPAGGGSAGGQGIQNLSGFDVNPPTAYLQSWNFTIERDLGGGNALELGYVGSKGTHLQRGYDFNQPFYDPALATENPDTGGLIFPRPIADFNRINYTSFGASSTYHGLQASLRRRSRGGFFYRFNYSFSKSIDDSSGGGGGPGGGGGAATLDSRNLRLDRGRSNFDQRHVVTASGLYELPFGHNRKWGTGWSRVTNAVLGGWQFSSTVQAYSGQPMTITTSNVDIQAGESARPNRIASGFQTEIPDGDCGSRPQRGRLRLV